MTTKPLFISRVWAVPSDSNVSNTLTGLALELNHLGYKVISHCVFTSPNTPGTLRVSVLGQLKKV